MKHFLYLEYSEDSLNRKSFETSTDCETRQFVLYQLLELYQKFESCLALFFKQNIDQDKNVVLYPYKT